MSRHLLEPDRKHLHGVFSRDMKPVLTIESGDTVRYRTLDQDWGLEAPTSAESSRLRVEPRRADLDDGPALVGPVAVEGAEPGMTLEVKIERLVPGSWGWTYAGGPGTFNAELNHRLKVASGERILLRWELDSERGTAVDQNGREISLRPFLGVIGMPPGLSGTHSGWFPRETGGNLDCKELVAGSTLFLPIEVSGGLVSIGDGHGAQGDGEAGGHALECPMELVELRYRLRDDLRFSRPCADTPAGRVTMGFSRELEEASAEALEDMVSWIVRRYGAPRAEALALASLTVDLRITQRVNGILGVHAVLPPDAIR